MPWRFRSPVSVDYMVGGESAPVREGGTAPPSAAAIAAAHAPTPVGPIYRLLMFAVAATVGVLLCRLLLLGLRTSIPTFLGDRFPSYYLMMLGGMLIGHWWTFRTVEPRGWASVALDRKALTLRQVMVGCALGAAAVGVPSAILLLIGWLRIVPADAGSWGATALGTLLLLIPAALWEELMTRGYPFAVAREVIGARAAIVVTSLFFGLLHVQNAGATFQSVALVTLAGIFLGAILVSTNSLYAAWSAHVTWNFVMAGVLHSTVSGIGMEAPNYRTVDAGPDWATGGPWGPEGGIVTAIGLVVGIYLMLRPKRRGVSAG